MKIYLKHYITMLILIISILSVKAQPDPDMFNKQHLDLLTQQINVVVDGVNGYFCSTTQDFKERMSQFYTMTDSDYSQFSKNARESIRDFDHNKYFADFEKIMSANNIC